VSTASAAADNPFFAEFVDDFFAECDEHMVIVRRGIVAIERFVGQRRVDSALLDELLRSFHTLKGLSGMVGVQAIELLAHHTESYLRALRDGQVVLTTAALGVLIADTKQIDQVLAAYRARQDPPDVAATVARLAALLPAAQAPAPGRAPSPAATQPALSEVEQARVAAALAGGTPVWRFVFTPSPALTERGVNVNVVRERLGALGEVLRAAPQVLGPGKIAFEFLVAGDADAEALAGWQDDGLAYERYRPPPAPADDPAAPATAAPASVVRVDLARIDEVMRIVGELVISRARLQDQLQPLEATAAIAAWRALHETTQALGRQLRDLRQGVMQMRLVPIGEAFARMQFVIRDLAHESGKQITLDLEGQDTEIDKFVVERMLDPLLHLVRNAAGHGLEPADERIAMDKPPAGRIALRAATAGDVVIVDIEDDGRGIDAEQVAARARALGLLDAGATLDTTALLDIICAPGFSTREQADRVSGRGVGMEAVKAAVEQLGGVLSLDTAVGRGTRFSIQLPLTLTIVDALIVAVGEHTFAVPMPSVREIVEIAPAALTRLENNELLAYRTTALPLVRVARRFGLDAANGHAAYALVVGPEQNATGIVVDRIRDKREIVVRTIGDPLIQVAGVAGATELGDGRPVLILDAAALARTARHWSRPGADDTPPVEVRAPAGRRGGQERDKAMADTQPTIETFVLFELVGATYGLPSRLVRRMDMVEQITPVPNAPPYVAGVVFSRGQVVPAIDLRARFGFEKIPYTLRTRLIVANFGERTIGLIADTAREFVKIASDAIQPPPEAIAGLSGAYIEGIARIGERLIVLLDLDQVLYGMDTIAPVREAG
jgi:two-component system chemotaxis sensor kinase CheA